MDEGVEDKMLSSCCANPTPASHSPPILGTPAQTGYTRAKATEEDMRTTKTAGSRPAMMNKRLLTGDISCTTGIAATGYCMLTPWADPSASF